jgi:hypothetical protein
MLEYFAGYEMNRNAVEDDRRPRCPSLSSSVETSAHFVTRLEVTVKRVFYSDTGKHLEDGGDGNAVKMEVLFVETVSGQYTCLQRSLCERVLEETQFETGSPLTPTSGLNTQ